MDKKMFMLLMIVFSMFFLAPKIEAKEIKIDSIVEYKLDDTDCEKIDSKGKFIAFLQELFNIMKYAGPILCLVLSTMDFIKAAASQDKEALKKAAQMALKRLGLAILLFFIPTLINFLFPLLGWNGTCGIS